MCGERPASLARSWRLRRHGAVRAPRRWGAGPPQACAVGLLKAGAAGRRRWRHGCYAPRGAARHGEPGRPLQGAPRWRHALVPWDRRRRLGICAASATPPGPSTSPTTSSRRGLLPAPPWGTTAIGCGRLASLKPDPSRSAIPMKRIFGQILALSSQCLKAIVSSKPSFGRR